MTIDERLERLTERHEALTQSVELQQHTVDKILEAIRKDSENIAALARIAESHDRRISQLGG